MSKPIINDTRAITPITCMDGMPVTALPKGTLVELTYDNKIRVGKVEKGDNPIALTLVMQDGGYKSFTRSKIAPRSLSFIL
jgi:hypothetical protein